MLYSAFFEGGAPEHRSESLFDNLISPRDSSSWSTLREAALNRNYEPLLTISTEHTDPHTVPSDVFYHRQCRQHFTLRVPPTTTETTTPSTQDTAKHISRRVLPQNTSRVLDAVCIFCRKVKCLPKTSTKEHLVQFREMRADTRIREYAKIKQDEYLLGVTGCYELVAAEAKYHPSCYQKCKRVTDDHVKQYGAVPVDVQTNQSASIDSTTDAFQFITDYIERLVFCGKQVVPLAEIANLYVAKLLECGQSEVSDSTKRNMRRKLERTFDDRLHFCQGKFIAVSDRVNKDILILK